MSQMGEKSGETGVWHSDTMASPAELILHDHCLDIGFSEDVDIGASVFLRLFR